MADYEEVQAFDTQSSSTAAARLVRNMTARWPDVMLRVNRPALIAHLARVHAAGGVRALAEDLGLRQQTVIVFLRQAPGRKIIEGGKS